MANNGRHIHHAKSCIAISHKSINGNMLNTCFTWDILYRKYPKLSMTNNIHDIHHCFSWSSDSLIDSIDTQVKSILQ